MLCIRSRKSSFHCIQRWNGQFFEKSALLMHWLTLDLHHYPDDCPAVPNNVETQMMFDPNMSDEGDNFPNDYQPSQTSTSTTQSGTRSHLIIVSSTGIFRRSIR